MMRRNIFELMQEKYNYSEEIKKLSVLLEEFMINCNQSKFTLEEFVDEYEFDNWKNSYHFIDCEELKDSIGINKIITYASRGKSLSIEEILLFLEYVLNIINLCEKSQQMFFRYTYFIKPYFRVKKNIEILLSNLNYEYKYFEKEEKVLLIEKDAAVFAVADIVEEELAFKVIEYNHYLLKNDLDRKRDILKALADKIESIRDKLDEDLSSDFGYLANNINIRHNNLEGKHKKEYLVSIDKKELEEWYDNTYQVMLLCILENNYKVELKSKIKEIKNKIN